MQAHLPDLASLAAATAFRTAALIASRTACVLEVGSRKSRYLGSQAKVASRCATDGPLKVKTRLLRGARET